MAKVIKKENEDLESMIKRFKKQVSNDGTLVALRNREYYKSPSQKRREKHERYIKTYGRFKTDSYK